MKYNLFCFTKLIVIVLVLSLSMALFSCNNTGETSLEISSELEIVIPEFTKEDAIKLLEQDRIITEIFVCNSLCDNTIVEAKRNFLTEDNKYAEFSAIESLMSSTYAKESGDKEFFLAYPMNNEPSVTNIDGKTSVFLHSGSDYDDFVDINTVSVAKTDDETVKIIKCVSKSGNKIEINAVYQDEVWLLKKGTYRSNPPKEIEFDSRFFNSGKGSLAWLKGKILVIEFFISDKETEITDNEEKAFHSVISASIDRLAVQASYYGEKTEFVYKTARFHHEDVLGEKVIDFDIMFAQTGFGTLRNFAESNYPLDEYDGYFFVVCLDKDVKTSVGYYDGNADTENHYGERIIISPKSQPIDIYRSIMKMLGAYSYDQGELDEYIESLYSFYFPTDSMQSQDMMNSVMSPVTAYSCGVTDKLDDLYRIFIPNN